MSDASTLEDVLRRTYSSIESIIENPICRGYLLKFSESQFNSENINFVSAVERFRDTFFAVDRNMWTSNWRDIDREVAYDEEKGNVLSDTWNSAINVISVKIHIDLILEEYVLDHAQHQICLSGQIVSRTKKRMNLLHLYGPFVFDEAVLDPIKTMKKDVLPRFLQSKDFRTMIDSVASCDPLPPASNLSLPPPTKYVLRSNPVEYFIDGREFTLVQLLQGEVLYTNFRVFLERNHCSENLICVRMIDYFEELKSKKDDLEADEFAWTIYQYFVAPGSCFEVCTMYSDRKNVMEALAVPRKGMFSKVRTSAYDVLKTNFSFFEKSDDYRALGKIMRFAKIKLDRIENTPPLEPVDPGCFSVMEILRSRSSSMDSMESLNSKGRQNGSRSMQKDVGSKSTNKEESVDFTSYVYSPSSHK
jgi:hypothetical protein